MQGHFKNSSNLNKTRVSLFAELDCVCVCVFALIMVNLAQVCLPVMSLTGAFQCDSSLLVNF